MKKTEVSKSYCKSIAYLGLGPKSSIPSPMHSAIPHFIRMHIIIYVSVCEFCLLNQARHSYRQEWNDVCFIALVWRLNEKIHVKHSWKHSKCWINGSQYDNCPFSIFGFLQTETHSRIHSQWSIKLWSMITWITLLFSLTLPLPVMPSTAIMIFEVGFYSIH